MQLARGHNGDFSVLLFLFVPVVKEKMSFSYIST